MKPPCHAPVVHTSNAKVLDHTLVKYGVNLRTGVHNLMCVGGEGADRERQRMELPETAGGQGPRSAEPSFWGMFPTLDMLGR